MVETKNIRQMNGVQSVFTTVDYGLELMMSMSRVFDKFRCKT